MLPYINTRKSLCDARLDFAADVDIAFIYAANVVGASPDERVCNICSVLT